eukprot:2417844-Amphidinium_carterae.1
MVSSCSDLMSFLRRMVNLMTSSLSCCRVDTEFVLMWDAVCMVLSDLTFLVHNIDPGDLVSAVFHHICGHCDAECGYGASEAVLLVLSTH